VPINVLAQERLELQVLLAQESLNIANGCACARTSSIERGCACVS